MKPTFKTNCPTHGNDSDSYLNGLCIQCDDAKKQHIENELSIRRFADNQKKSNIPFKFLLANFDNYVASNDLQKSIKQELMNFNLDGNILLLGMTGTGKTHLATAILNKMLWKGVSCYYAKFYKLAYYKIKQPTEFNRIIESELLVMDEFGVEDSEYKSTTLFEVIDERYDKNLPTILISNKTADEVRENISHATYSRIKECCHIYQFPFDDYRIIKAKNFVNQVDVSFTLSC